MLIPQILKEEKDLIILYWETGKLDIRIPNYEISFYEDERVVVRFSASPSSFEKKKVVFNGKICEGLKKFISFDMEGNSPTNLVTDIKHIRCMAVKLESLNKFS